MSEEKKAQEKMDTLFNKVYLPSFIEKLAERGVVPQSQEQVEELLKIAAMARMHAEAAATEAPAEETDVIKAASASLARMTFGDQEAVQAILQDPEVANVFQG